jgi:protoheme IX farnesyltransferase
MRRLVITRATGAVQVEGRVERPRVPGEPPSVDEGDIERTLSLREKALAYFSLTKPRIIELLLVTTLPAMIVAKRGWPSLELVAFTLVGGALSAGGANAINCFVDRDIDEVMPRTHRRPLPTRKIKPRNALAFGVALGSAAFLLLWATVNLLSAALAAGALLFYVFVYTVALKRRTPQNIVIGGAAGAVPVLVGWSAVTGSVDLPALALFAIVFYWTPPHFWALAMRYESEYRAAGVPMMPVVYGKKETAKHILLYGLMLLAVCLAFFSVGRMGLVYLGCALVLNGIFIGWAIRLYRRPEAKVAYGLFRYSIHYLALLFTAAAADALLSF